jgi:hypothetical protein
LYGLATVSVIHAFEHIFQMFQIHSMHMSRAEAGGLLGYWYPWLMKSELLHFSYALFMLIGLVVLYPGFAGRSRNWWATALLIQVWHCFEHTLLLYQASTENYLFGGTVPTSVLQLVIPKAELHFFYTSLVLIPMGFAMMFYQYQPQQHDNTQRDSV